MKEIILALIGVVGGILGGGVTGYFVSNKYIQGQRSRGDYSPNTLGDKNSISIKGRKE